jgi:ketosteroid isomerase-like protein
MTIASAATAVAERLTRAVADNDVDALAALYAPGSVVWHSTDQVELKFVEVQHLVQAIREVAHCTIAVSATLTTDRGFVQTQENTYTFRDGTSTRFHAALVVTLDNDGRIARLEEYLDSAGLAPLIAALGAL